MDLHNLVDDSLPCVSVCLSKAKAEILVSLDQDIPQGIVNAVILFATALRSLEREGFRRALAFDRPDAIAVDLIQDSMDGTFSHILEALGHIAIIGVCHSDHRVSQLVSAEYHTTQALDIWSTTNSLQIVPGPQEIQ